MPMPSPNPFHRPFSSMFFEVRAPVAMSLSCHFLFRQRDQLRDFTHGQGRGRRGCCARARYSRMGEMDELRARLAQVELERDQAVADFNRRNTQLAQMEETQRTLHEHLYILKTKYETAKVRRPPLPLPARRRRAECAQTEPGGEPVAPVELSPVEQPRISRRVGSRRLSPSRVRDGLARRRYTARACHRRGTLRRGAHARARARRNEFRPLETVCRPERN